MAPEAELAFSLEVRPAPLEAAELAREQVNIAGRTAATELRIPVAAAVDPAMRRVAVMVVLVSSSSAI